MSEAVNREDCKNWHVAVLTLWSSLLLVAVLMFAPGYVSAASMHRDYTNATCIIVNGSVQFSQCPVGGWSCHDCYQDCWKAFSAVSAVPGVSIYYFVGTFLNQATANATANRDVGKAFGVCYYTNGGRTVRYSLPDPEGYLIAAAIFLGFCILVIIWWLILFCRDHNCMIATRQSLGNKISSCLQCCKSKCCRRRGYSSFDASTTSNRDIDVL